MKVIGLIGEKGSGKQTFVNFLKEIASASPRNDVVVRQVRFSDILAETLMVWDIPVTRSNLQHLAIMMNATFGETALANAAKFSVEGDSADVVVFDGIRREPELELVKKMPKSSLIYITTEQKLRYKRLKKRSEKVGEAGLTFEQFLKEEGSKAEVNISTLGKKANIKLENNGSLEEFRSSILKVWQALAKD